MSTTVNVRVIGGGLKKELDTAAAVKQQQAAQQAVDAAAAEQVRSNNEALRRRQEDAVAKFRKPRHDPTARRDDGDLTLPNQLVDGQLTGPVVVQDGAAIRVARVGVRRNTSGTKIFVYPWGIEGALGQRLSNDYATAVSEAFGVGVEIEFSQPSPQVKPEPEGTVGAGPKYTSYSGKAYDVTPYAYTSLRMPYCYKSIGGKRVFEVDTGGICLVNGTSDERFGRYDFAGEESITFNGQKLSCWYYGGYDADQAASNRNQTIKTFADLAVATTTFASVGSSNPFTQTHQVCLPAGGDKTLVVLIHRSLSAKAFARFFWEYSITNYTFSGNEGEENARFCTDIAIEGYLQPTSNEEVLQDAIVNEVRCVLVSGSLATEIEPSAALVEACDELIGKIAPAEATGVVESTNSVMLSYKAGSYAALRTPGQRFNYPIGISYPLEQETRIKPKTPAFELSNLSKQPYSDKPPEQQVLAKQLGIGYLETSDHSGKFFTPAVYQWLAGNATLTTRYSEVAPAFYQPGNANNPFVGVYLSVTNGKEDAIEMRATATQPIDITTAHTALDWVTVNTGSRYGDYLVWDWGNPEYCQQRLQALGMNV